MLKRYKDSLRPCINFNNKNVKNYVFSNRVMDLRPSDYYC